MLAGPYQNSHRRPLLHGSKKWHSFLSGAIILAATLGGMGGSASAVHPRNWTHQVQSDYIEGQFDNVVVDNFGTLALGRQLQEISIDDDLSFVNSFAQTPDDKVYFSTSPDGAVYVIKDAAAQVYFTAPENQDQILSLAVNKQGHLLVAVCGDGAKLLELTPPPAGSKPDEPPVSKTLFSQDTVDYIWAIKEAPDGSIYLGTGPKGQVWKIAPDGKATVALDTTAKNVLALAFDKSGNLLAGTDSRGLVLRLDAQTHKPFVLLDAGDVDVSALIPDAQGNIYVATATPKGGGSDGDMDTGHQKSSQPTTFEAEPDEPLNADDGAAPPTTPATTRPAATAPKPGLRKSKPVAPEKKDGKITPPPGAQGTTPESRILALSSVTMPLSMEKLKLMMAPSSPTARRSPGRKRLRPPMTARGLDKKRGLNMSSRADEDEDAGNAVYKITPAGLVVPVLHSSETLLSLLWQQDELLLGTGTEGKLYTLRPETEEQTLIGRVDSENIMSLFAARDGTVYAGMSNPGTVFTLSAAPADKGSFTSAVLDAKHAATWGSATLAGTIPVGAKATLAVRIGNVREVKKQAKFWSEWSKEIPVETIGTGTGVKIDLPPARYLQYRITLTANDQGQSPQVQQVQLSYQVENLAPQIQDLSVETGSESYPEKSSPPIHLGAKSNNNKNPKSSPEKPEPNDHSVKISWEVTDPNQDELVYRLYYRAVGSDLWLPLAKDLKETDFEWPTPAIPDGKYQIKLTASDAPDNPQGDAKSVARVSTPFLIVNTPPTLADLKTITEGGKVTLTGTARSKLAAVTEVRYQIDNQGDWQPATASDKMFDSPTEGFTLTTRNLGTGGHSITVRATDAAGNLGYQTLTVNLK